ncbi:MAG: ABC transporter permease subunit [Planctomycetes bacterium]|nr:ABC transporter permease subunit [Planctomycetota bacterium]
MVFAVLGQDGQLVIENVRARRNIMTGKTTFTKQTARLPFDKSTHRLPMFLRLAGLGDNVFVAWEDGTLVRYDTRNLAAPVVAEEMDLVPEPGGSLTALEFLIGKATLVSGDSVGNVRAWFRVKPEPVATLDDGKQVIATRDLPASVASRLVHPSAQTLPQHLRDRAKELAFMPSNDGSMLVPAHLIHTGKAGVVALASSARTRLLAASYADGSASLHQVTSEKHLATVSSDNAAPFTSIAITPKDDGLVAVTAASAYSWAVDVGYPETTTLSLLGKVWYEGYEKPEHIWQSVGGTDDFEPKLGLVPLIFGTLKATIYSLMFGVPIALLAAIYTSEFLSPRARGQIKPAIEMMASLPSVVLGFIAALVIAPAVEGVVPALLCALICVPLVFLIGAYVWQLLPYKIALGYGHARFPLMVLAFPLGLWLSYIVGPWVEHWFFAGNIKLWLNWAPSGTPADLDSAYHSAVGGWMLLFVPLSAALVGFAIMQFLNPMIRPLASTWDRKRAALMDVVKFLAAAAATLVLALFFSAALSAIGFDARGSFIDTYVQRNAMVVGLIMGFAIIPIVYTISDDALNSVPRHLRSASLGAGATQWQTTIRIIVPTAMSGLFSAVMIGIGRAVGETMIVLMAAGNTAVLEWNIFSGFRTLSANIAVELPEAVKNSTHFRTLFLAALVLFAMTFVLNTIAEMVRLRFRKRAFQL